jgi:hypothetical protein
MKKKKKVIWLVMLVLLFIVFSMLICFYIGRNSSQLSLLESHYPSNYFYKIFSYNDYYSSIDELYTEEAKQILDRNKKTAVENSTNIRPDENKQSNPPNHNENTDSEYIIINSSLTNTPGAISVSGESSGINVFYGDNLVNQSGNHFQFMAGSSYTLKLNGSNFKKKISISSPSYGTNKMLSRLTLQVNPITMMATIIGQIHLLLPGEIKGSLYNVTASSSSTTILNKGYFATSVSLQEGENQLTASGQWYTIKLDLPSIKVVVTK